MLDLSRIGEAVRSEGGISRRLFLAYGAALAAIALPGGAGIGGGPQGHLRERSVLRSASHRAIPTRRASCSGRGSLPSRSIPTAACSRRWSPVAWEVAEDEAMKKVVRPGTTVATPQLGHSVHVEVDGLKPDRWYWYRFTAGDAVSPVGRTRTLPAADATPEKLRFAFASCQHYEQGLFTAYEHMAKDDLDLVFHLGDYIYEYPRQGQAGPQAQRAEGCKAQDAGRLPRPPRPVPGRPAPAGDARHGARGSSPGTTTSSTTTTPTTFRRSSRRANRQAEPGRVPGAAGGRLPGVLRDDAAAASARCRPGRTCCCTARLRFGRLAEFFVLDTRQYRTDQPNGDGTEAAQRRGPRSRRTRCWASSSAAGSTPA